MKHVDFNVSMALVDYVQRPSAQIGDWGLTDATRIRIKLCELQTTRETVPLSEFNQWLSEQRCGKLGRGSSRFIDRLMHLMRRASNHNIG